MIVAGHEFPDKCPDGCPHRDKDEIVTQGSVCYRCPLYCCSPRLDHHRDVFYFVEPEEYRPDWAAEWRRWFDSGMAGEPELLFVVSSTHAQTPIPSERPPHS